MTEKPSFYTSPGFYVAGLSERHQIADLADVLPAQWRRFMEMQELPGIGDAYYGIIEGMDPDEGILDHLCGVEVADIDNLPDNADRMYIPEAEYAVFTHNGATDTLGDSWAYIMEDALPNMGLQIGGTPSFERYGPGYDPTKRKGDIEIWVPILRG